MIKSLAISGLFLVGLTTWAMAAPATNQNIAEIKADPTSFKESYDSEVPVSGSTIVGVRLGHSDGNVAVDETMLAAVNSTDICVRTVTRDGRFSASNIYKSSGLPPKQQKVRLSPITLKYSKALSNYKFDDFAVFAFPAQDGACFPENVAFLPQLASNQTQLDQLTILINSSGRYSEIIIEHIGKKIYCQRFSQGSQIAYDQACEVDTSLLSTGNNRLKLVLDDGFEEEIIHFTVFIPVFN